MIQKQPINHNVPVRSKNRSVCCSFITTTCFSPLRVAVFTCWVCTGFSQASVWYIHYVLLDLKSESQSSSLKGFWRWLLQLSQPYDSTGRTGAQHTRPFNSREISDRHYEWFIPVYTTRVLGVRVVTSITVLIPLANNFRGKCNGEQWLRPSHWGPISIILVSSLVTSLCGLKIQNTCLIYSFCQRFSALCTHSVHLSEPTKSFWSRSQLPPLSSSTAKPQSILHYIFNAKVKQEWTDGTS